VSDLPSCLGHARSNSHRGWCAWSSSWGRQQKLLCFWRGKSSKLKKWPHLSLSLKKLMLILSATGWCWEVCKKGNSTNSHNLHVVFESVFFWFLWNVDATTYKNNMNQWIHIISKPVSFFFAPVSIRPSCFHVSGSSKLGDALPTGTVPYVGLTCATGSASEVVFTSMISF